MLDLVRLMMMPMIDGLLGWFAETTLVASALAAVAALVARSQRLAPGPAARHALWLMVLLKLVTPPLVHWPWSVTLPIAAHRPELHSGQVASILDAASVHVVRDATVPDPATISRAAAPPREDGGMMLPALLRDPIAIRPPRSLGAWIALAWVCGTVALGVQQGRRVCRFRRLLIDATPAPGWLVEEATQLGRRLAVRVPSILVVPGLGTPVLWCLSRPVLLVPAKLLGTLEADRWRSIVAHELAHLRRGDHWVRRLELAAGLAWWWNPLYWLARSRLDSEAELACDAWAVWALPADRLTYAESLIRICTSLSPARSPAPALGVAGTGRSFERRLTMILHNRADHRVSPRGVLAASLLAALALPSWTLAEPPRAEDTPPVGPASKLDLSIPMEVVVNDDDKEDKASAEAANLAKFKIELEKSQKKLGELDKQMQEKFGPDSDFTKQMEAFGKEMEGKFGPGSDFTKQMEALGKEMEAKFGPNSDFAKQMAKNFGPGSDFAEKMAEAMKDGPSDDAKAKLAKLKAEADKARAKARGEADKAREANKAKARSQQAKVKAETKDKLEARAKTKSTPDQRTRRIEQLESRINEMMAELKKLKAESQPDEDDDDQRGDTSSRIDPGTGRLIGIIRQ